MSQAEQLHALASAMEALAESGLSITADRQSRLTERRTATTALEDAWRSPVADELRAEITTFLERCEQTRQPFERGYGNLDELAVDARRIAGELQEASTNELSWLEQVHELGKAVYTGAQDVLAEMDPAAHERALEEYNAAQRRHQAAQSRREELESEWRRVCAAATTGIASAVQDLQTAESQLRQAMPEDDVDPRQLHGDVQLQWSRYATVVLSGASASEQRSLWGGLDGTERSVLIELMPGLVRSELWHALSARERELWESENAYRTSSTSSSVEWRLGFPVKGVAVGVGGGVEAEVSSFSDGSVELKLEADLFVEAGVSTEFLEAFLGIQAGGWMTLRFEDADEYETFVAELTAAVERDLEGLEPDTMDLVSLGLLGPVGGVAAYSWRRRDTGKETATVMDSANVVSAGVETAAYRRIKTEIPDVVSTASRLEAGSYHDIVTGETGVFLSGSLSGKAQAGRAGGGASIDVDGRVFQTADGRNYLTVATNSDLLTSTTLSGDLPGAGEAEGGVTAGTHTESTLTVEINSENTDQVTQLLAGLANSDTQQVASAAAALADASHLTHTSYLSGEGSTGFSLGSDMKGGGSATATAGTTQTLTQWEKRPFDQGYTH